MFSLATASALAAPRLWTPITPIFNFSLGDRLWADARSGYPVADSGERGTFEKRTAIAGTTHHKRLAFDMRQTVRRAPGGTPAKRQGTRFGAVW